MTGDSIGHIGEAPGRKFGIGGSHRDLVGAVAGRLLTDAGDAAERFRQHALSLGVDAGRYDACVKDARTDARIRQDLEEGTKLGVRGTPAFFLNRVDAQGRTLTTRPISGALPFEQFDQTIKAMLGQ